MVGPILDDLLDRTVEESNGESEEDKKKSNVPNVQEAALNKEEISNDDQQISAMQTLNQRIYREHCLRNQR